MIASFPMYATPRTASADARFWALIRDGLRKQRIGAPEHLTLAPPDLMAHWRAPDLILSQTCGLPYRATLQDHVTLIGTPDYGIKGCPPGYYQSKVIARADDSRDTLASFRTARFAYNDPMSQSGWAALALEVPEVLQGPLIHTGSHRASILAVREGKADFAAVDTISLRHRTATIEATGLRVIHATRPTPGLPYIAAKGHDPDQLSKVVAQAITALPRADRETLFLKGLVKLPQNAYNLPLPPTPAAIVARRAINAP